MNFLSIFENIFRWILWVILKLLLFIIDILYDAIKSIAFFNVLDNNNVWSYFSIFVSAFLVLFIVIRLAKRYLKTLVDDEEAEHFKPENLILKIAAIGFLILVLPFILKSFGNLLSQLVNKIEVIFGVQTNSFSAILLSSAHDNIDINNIDIIDINEKNGDAYRYLPNLNTFLILFIASVFSGYLMLLIGIQIGGRLLSMVMKLIIAPYSLSSIVDERNDSFPTWWKLFIADFLSTYIQMILLLVGTTLILGFNFASGNEFTSGLAKDIALIGALFGVLNAPNGISQIIGSDIGVSSALQSLQTTMMGMNIASSAGRLIGGTATYAGAAATYLTGRAVGGASMKNIANNTTPTSRTITGTLMGSGGGFQSGEGFQSGGGGNVPSGSLDLSMHETPGQQGSIVSDRSGLHGIPNAFRNSHGIGDFVSNIKSAGLPNMAGAVSNINQNNGSVRDMANKGNIGGMAIRGMAWGASKMYGASMNRLQKGFSGHRQPQNGFSGHRQPHNSFNNTRNMMMYNTVNQPNIDINNTGGKY